jgi:23S rRNA (pseudouridine1915-N3)-methyltransferase
MNLSVISVGNKPNKWELEGIDHYLKQLKNNIKINFINIKGQQNPKRTIDEVIKIESGLILEKIPSASYLISWDIEGEKINSKELSMIFERSKQTDAKICFVIGGSFGLSKDIKNLSDKVISASNFTFPHRLFRIILIEQIYRAVSIINNMPYHK